MYKRGEIYLASLNPKKGNEVGKLRPVLVLQTDMLNDIGHTTTTVLPLSTKLIDDAYPLRFRVVSRGDLREDSDILCDQIRTVDNGRIVGKRLCTLNAQELLAIEKQVKIILGIQ